MAETTKLTPIAIDRSDLIKRLFAVSLSVGFATQIAKMSWLTEGRLPVSGELPDLFLLIVSLFIIVLSWDGYLAAIQKFPPTDIYRFLLDVGIVFFLLNFVAMCPYFYRYRVALSHKYYFHSLHYLGLSYQAHG